MESLAIGGAMITLFVGIFFFVVAVTICHYLYHINKRLKKILKRMEIKDPMIKCALCGKGALSSTVHEVGGVTFCPKCYSEGETKP